MVINNYLVIFVLLLSSSFHSINGRKNHRETSSVVIVGTVFCETCFGQALSKSGHFISGASVKVECKDTSKNTVLEKTALTNKKGAFKFHLPSEMRKNIQSIKNCTIGLIKTSHATLCDASSSISATSTSGLRFKSKIRNNNNVYSAGLFTFKPLKQPATCDQKVNQPAFDFFPPNPFAPPNIGGVPIPGNPFQPPNVGGVPIPQNPFQPPPPSLFPPGLPFQPSPPPSIVPPFPGFQPSPPPPVFNLPHLPFLTPPPPPPAPPAFQIPGFPFPPGFPGVPPSFPGFPSKRENPSP